MLPTDQTTRHAPFRSWIVAALTLLTSIAGAAPSSWLPGTGGSVPASGFQVNTSSRDEVLSFHNCVYRPGEKANAEMGWTGNFSTGVHGTTSAPFREHVRRRVNYYRALAGVPADITFDAIGAQNLIAGPTIPSGTTKLTTVMSSSLMNCVEHALDNEMDLTHTPPSSFAYYTAAAWHGCRYSNLCVGFYGTEAMDVYMLDNDINDEQLNNINVGHRRWMLYSRALDMSTGDVPTGNYTDSFGSAFCYGANSLYILGTVRPVQPPAFVSWPNAGWCPAALVPQRWSLSYPGAIFSSATVTVTGPSGAVPVNIISSDVTNVGDNSIVFIPTVPAQTFWNEQTWTVTVSGITGSGIPGSYSWQTKGLNTESIAMPTSLTGPASPPAAGAAYTFTSVPAASSYDLRVDSTSAPATYAQGAEDSQAADINDLTGPEYTLRESSQTFVTSNGTRVPFSPRTGSRAIHLAFPPGDADQIFEIVPEFLLTSTSRFDYYNCFRWLLSNNRLSLELSADGGNNWTEIDGRNGAYTYVPNGTYNTALWDKNSDLSPSWKLRSVSLTPWAGKVVKFRFILRAGGNGQDHYDSRHGCYIDDISILATQRLTPAGALNSATPSFTLNAGNGLTAGQNFLLRAAPVIGCYRMSWAPHLPITPTSVTGFNGWIAGFYPNLTGGINGDFDHDTIPNAVEYVLGTNPTDPGSGPGAIPTPSLIEGVPGTPDKFQLTVPVSRIAAGVTLSGEYSCNLRGWQPVPNTGPVGTCTLCVDVQPGQTCGYFRLKVTAVP